MEIVDAEKYRVMLESELRSHASQSVELLIVEDIADWVASRNGNAKGNPPAMAVTDGATGGWAILSRRSIDSAWIASILSRIEFGGFHQTRSILALPETLLRHTVLHQLAHLENGAKIEKKRAMSGHLQGSMPMQPNLAVNRTRRLMLSTWRAPGRRAGYLQR